MANSNLLNLLLLQTGGQANAEAVVNDMFETIEAFAVGLPVEDVSDTPSVTTDGTCYIVGASPSGDFSAFSEHDVAVRLNGGWVAITPAEGWRATMKTTGNSTAVFTGSAWQHEQDEVQAVVLASPGTSEDVTVFFSEHAITVAEINAVVRGTSSPDVTWTVRHAADRGGAGNEVVTGGTTTSSTSTGDSITSFNDATIPAGSWVWLETTATTGTVAELAVSIRFRRDLT